MYTNNDNLAEVLLMHIQHTSHFSSQPNQWLSYRWATWDSGIALNVYVVVLYV